MNNKHNIPPQADLLTTLDSLAELADPDRNPGVHWTKLTLADCDFRSALVNAWPQIRERLRAAELLAEMAATEWPGSAAAEAWRRARGEGEG